MSKHLLVICLLICPVQVLWGQSTFPERVAAAFGSDQELVNGIQFINQYRLVDGQPYFLDETFREGSLCVNGMDYEDQRIRYNLYSQKVEVEYHTREGYLNQYISVPEMIPSFTLENRSFVRMKPGEDPPAYYQVISWGGTTCYIGWNKVMKLGRGDSSREYMFSEPVPTFWLEADQQFRPFHNRKTLAALFPAHLRKDLKRLFQQRRYSIRQAGITDAEAMIREVLMMYERNKLP